MGDEQLKKISVSAGKRKELEVDLSETGHHSLQWFFTTSSDIDFGIFTEDNKEVGRVAWD